MKLNISLSANPLLSVPKKERKKVAKLLNGLNKESAEALLTGSPPPEFDLCEITVPGTNLFCHGNKGVPRANMPQLKGFPVPDSTADSMAKDKNGKVDVSQNFLEMLEEKGIKTKRFKISPTKLKATQNQLVGARIAMRVGQMQDNPNHKKFKMPYFISKDGYILDGHHGWASVLAYCLIHKVIVKINVIEVDMPIKKLVKLANKFTTEIGIAQKIAAAGN